MNNKASRPRQKQHNSGNTKNTSNTQNTGTQNTDDKNLTAKNPELLTDKVPSTDKVLSINDSRPSWGHRNNAAAEYGVTTDSSLHTCDTDAPYSATSPDSGAEQQSGLSQTQQQFVLRFCQQLASVIQACEHSESAEIEVGRRHINDSQIKVKLQAEREISHPASGPRQR